MKAFRCGDVVPGCRAELVGADEDAVLAAVAEHARREHGLDPDDALAAQVRPLVRDLPDPPGAAAAAAGEG